MILDWPSPFSGSEPQDRPVAALKYGKFLKITVDVILPRQIESNTKVVLWHVISFLKPILETIIP